MERDEALDIVRKNYPHVTQSGSQFETALRTLIPELKESEDERIRKAILELVKQSSHILNPMNQKSMIAYLEKQGLQNLANSAKTCKVEPKFHKGEWVFIEEVKGYKNGPFRIKALSPFGYDFDKYHIIPFEHEHVLSKWTIQDAKDGDVVVSNQIIVLFKKFQEDSDCNFIIAYAGIDVSGKLQITDGHWLISNDSKLATKEQHDTLFAKIKEAGYEWNGERKELKKIEQKPVLDDVVDLPEDNWEFVHEFVEKFGRLPKDEDELNVLVEYVLKRQNPSAWNKDDEYYYGIIQCVLNNECVGKVDKKNAINWFKDLRIRVQSQSKSEWNEEDEEMFGYLEDIVNFCYCNQYVVNVQTCEKVRQLVFRLKSLCFQSGWRKDDITRINEIIETLYIVQANRLRTQRTHYSKATIDKDIDFLKSLKERYTWKPTDGQINALARFTTIPALESLYNDLKKLK